MVNCGTIEVVGFDSQEVEITGCEIDAPSPFDPHGEGHTFTMEVGLANHNSRDAVCDVIVTAGGTTIQTDRGVTVNQNSTRLRSYSLGGFSFPLSGGQTYDIVATLANIEVR